MNIRNFLMISMVLFMAPNFVFAQDNDEATDVEEIIVTATKRETNLMETPLAVSVITQEQMALQGLSRISDLSSLVPNLVCLLYTSPSPRDEVLSRMPSSA